MGHPQRAADSGSSASRRSDIRQTGPYRDEGERAVSEHDDPFVSVEDWFDDEESCPWCVDSGSAIRVMSTRAVYESVEKGDLSPDMKVWRDGRACWLPIAECYELTVKPPPLRDPTPVSGVRRVRTRHASLSAPTLPPRLPGDPLKNHEPNPHSDADARATAHPTLMLTTSFAIGLVIGALIYLPFAW